MEISEMTELAQAVYDGLTREVKKEDISEDFYNTGICVSCGHIQSAGQYDEEGDCARCHELAVASIEKITENLYDGLPRT